jgi:hypothetical protein
MFAPKSLDTTVRDAAANLFTPAWLAAADDWDLPGASTPNCHVPSEGYLRFGSNYERFAAQELTKRLDGEAFGRKGFILQAVAAGWHYKTAAQLRELADRVGRDRICVIHARDDKMLGCALGERLMEELGEVQRELCEEGGHVLMAERTMWWGDVVEGLWARAEKLEN